MSCVKLFIEASLLTSRLRFLQPIAWHSIDPQSPFTSFHSPCLLRDVDAELRKASGGGLVLRTVQYTASLCCASRVGQAYKSAMGELRPSLFSSHPNPKRADHQCSHHLTLLPTFTSLPCIYHVSIQQAYRKQMHPKQDAIPWTASHCADAHMASCASFSTGQSSYPGFNECPFRFCSSWAACYC